MKSGFSRVLYVTGFPAAVRHGELTTKFEEFGRIVGTKMPIANGPNEFPYAFIEFEASMSATTARSSMHHSLVRGERIEVHFDSKIPPHLRPRFDDDISVDVSPISPIPPPPMSRGGSNEGRPYANDKFKSYPMADKPDYKDNYASDKRPNARHPHDAPRQFGNGANQRSVPRGARPGEGGGAYQGGPRWNNSGANVDRRPPTGPARQRPYSANQGPPRPYDRNNGAAARGGYRERGFRGRAQGGDVRNHGSHINIRGAYADHEASNSSGNGFSPDGHSQHHDINSPPPPQMRGRYNDGYADRAKESGEDWQSGDDDGQRSQPRHYSNSRSPSPRRTRSISPDRNDLDHQGGKWDYVPHPDDEKLAAPSSVSPQSVKQSNTSGGGGSSSYFDDEFSIAPEVQPRTYSP
ncbi:hypothetical protein GGI19_002747 [Coemansia pectinata]|uniref:RRM domain-containing protein n=1 Tax=Coemansia pectinata TaxID=1052879 RepID=A0A9W8LBL9_9FUNG|nr:hypothetical protein GGI19_002747 [Coemansia pectinata]